MTNLNIHGIKSIKISNVVLPNTKTHVKTIRIKTENDFFLISLFSDEKVEIQEVKK